MLKNIIRENIVNEMKRAFYTASGDGVLATYVANQRITDKLVDDCFEVMLKHVSKEELSALLNLFNSELYKRYSLAVQESFGIVSCEVESALDLLTKSEGSA